MITKISPDKQGTFVSKRLQETEGKVAERNTAVRQIMDTAHVGIGLVDRGGRFVEANRHMADLFGCTMEELIGSLYTEHVHPSERAVSAQSMQHFLDGELPSIEIDRLYIRKDGTAFWGHLTCNRFSDPHGNHAGLIGTITDISGRKRSEEELKKREKQLAESQRIAHIGSWERNLTTGEIFWSDERFRLFGLDPDKDRANFGGFMDMIHPDDKQRVQATIANTVREHKPYSIDYRIIQKNGTVRFMHAQAELVRDTSGTQLILSGTTQDITERKQAEEALRRSEQFIRSILDTVDEGFIVIDRDYRIVTANKAYCSQLALNCDDVIGRNCFEISHGLDRPCHDAGEECAVQKAFATGEPHTVLHKHVDHEGHVLYVETKGFPIRDATGTVTSVIETVNNITEKHLLEEERLKTQKLESIGTLAGGIAHDFNNLLQGIFGYISMAKMNYEKREKSLAMLGQAENALQQAVNLTTQLLTFSKGGKPVKKLIDLRPVIENAARFTLSGSRSDFQLSIAETLWPAEADEGQVGQVIQNIVLNADQAMPLGGSVMVTAKNVPAKDASLPPGLAPVPHVMISVEDTGVGIPAQYINRIFDPYFTTKEKGSGLGLATSYSIVRNHGGLIDIRTKPGEGSTFSIYLPATVIRDRTASPGAAAPAQQRKARILVMDDEEYLRNLSRELISALGHEPDVVRNGQEALEKYQAATAGGKPFDAVILDLTVRGGMGGLDTLRNLLKIDPSVKAIVSSGYSADAAIADHQAHGFKAYLKKPYNIGQLRDILGSLLS